MTIRSRTPFEEVLREKVNVLEQNERALRQCHDTLCKDFARAAEALSTIINNNPECHDYQDAVETAKWGLRLGE